MNKQILLKYRVVLICLGLAVMTFAAFEGVRHNDFINFDDNKYVTENHNVQKGISFDSLAWAFTSLHGGTSYWHPITWISHMLDCQLYELKPAGHHITSLLLHVLNTLLLFWLLKRMTADIP